MIAAQSHPPMRSVPGTPALSPLFVLGGCHHAHLNVISFVDKLVALRSMQNAGRCTVDMAIPEYGHWPTMVLLGPSQGSSQVNLARFPG